MRFLLTLLLLFSFQIFAVAQKITLEGQVSESDRNTRLAGVSIEVLETSKTGVTNREGRFSFELQPGSYTLRVSSVGFQTKEISGVEIVADRIATADIVLERQAKTEEGVVVRASARKETVNALIAYQ